jgi:anti-anti-sigma factor
VDARVRVEVVAGRPVLSVDGAIDVSSLPVLQDRLLRTLADHPGVTLTVDLDGATVVDDAALGVLLGAAGRARAGGGDLEVVATAERTRERLALTGFERAVTVRSSLV